MRLICIVGARPNFMKIAPILSALKKHPEINATLVHTGQHYDKKLSDVFFDELGIKPPDISLGIGSGSHGAQTAAILVAVEKILVEASEQGNPFDRMVVVGDVNSTMAATIAAVKLHIPVAHVEAGLRSFDREMPEEINRLITDSICDMMLVSEPAGVEQLMREGHPSENIHLVGNTMIDTLLTQVERAKNSDARKRHGLETGKYGVVTLHRPSNVDDPEILSGLVKVLIEISKEMKLAFPIHPRTKARLAEFGLEKDFNSAKGIICLEPLGYLDFLCLTSGAKVIVTDSGGLQEESTALGVPCLTMRLNTERPITVDQGTSTLIGNSAEKLRTYLRQVLDGTYKTGLCPKLWDGRAAERIAQVIADESAKQ